MQQKNGVWVIEHRGTLPQVQDKGGAGGPLDYSVVRKAEEDEGRGPGAGSAARGRCLVFLLHPFLCFLAWFVPLLPFLPVSLLFPSFCPGGGAGSGVGPLGLGGWWWRSVRPTPLGMGMERGKRVPDSVVPSHPSQCVRSCPKESCLSWAPPPALHLPPL